MSANRPLGVVACLVVLLGALGLASATSAPGLDPQPTDEAFKPVARVSSLMWGLGSAFGQLNDVFPKTEDEHRNDAIIAWSEVIAELSNVHTKHGRKSEEYLEMAGATRTIALDLSRAARAESPDEDRMAALIKDLDTSCATCHESDH